MNTFNVTFTWLREFSNAVFLYEDAANLAKNKLKRLGWSYRKAAVQLGVGYPHLSDVLNGHRKSRRLLAAIAALPPSPTPYHPIGFARQNKKGTR